MEAAQLAGPIPPNLGNSSGSGFFVNSLGHLITNAHVVSSCKTIVGSIGEERFSFKLVRKDELKDLAILKANESKKYRFAYFSQSIRTGEDVVAVGFPLGKVLGEEIKATVGNIAALSGYEGDANSLQFTAPVQPGNSGGPLLNSVVAIVGVNTSTLKGEKIQNVNFAVKASSVQVFLGQNRIPFVISGESKELRNPDIVEKAKTFTAQIFCINH